MTGNDFYQTGMSPSGDPRGQGRPPRAPRDEDGGGRWFFRWVRESCVVRTNDRWIGGVCGALARRLGWSPSFVRAIMLLCVFAAGAGLAFYGFAWFILPDEDDTIVCEDLIDGRWRGDAIGVIICLIITFCLPGVGLFALAVAAGLLYLFLRWSRQRAMSGMDGYEGGDWHRQEGGSAPSDRRGSGYGQGGWNPEGAWMPQGSDDGPGRQDTDQGYRPSPFLAGWEGPEGGADPAYGSRGWYGAAPDYRTAPDRQAGPASGGIGGPAYAAGPAPSSVPPGWGGSGPGRYAPTVKRPARRLRRRPAGFAIVASVMGLILISGAITALVTFNKVTGFLDVSRVALYWTAGICLLVGIVTVALGSVGRRSGGLTVISVLTVISLLSVTVGVANLAIYENGFKKQMAGYQHLVVNGEGMGRVIGSTTRDMKAYARGYFFTGDESKQGRVVLDLSDFEKNNGTHKVDYKGRKADSGCPTGRIQLAVEFADVKILVPKECTYYFSQYHTDFLWGDTGGKADGGTPRDWWDYIMSGRQARSDGYREGDWVAGPGVDPSGDYGDSGNPELYIEVSPAIHGRMTVEHKGHATVPWGKKNQGVGSDHDGQGKDAGTKTKNDGDDHDDR